MAIVFVLITYLMRKDDIRLTVHKKLLRMPVVGKLLCTINTARFASTLSILTSSGVALVDAMRIAGEVLSNDWLRLRVSNATRSVSEGSSLKNALEQAGYFPPMMLHMIASGEASAHRGFQSRAFFSVSSYILLLFLLLLWPFLPLPRAILLCIKTRHHHNISSPLSPEIVQNVVDDGF